jgi:ATP-dependent DNA helicase RecG
VEEAELRALIAEGESFTVEFKSAANDAELVEAATCLANGEGGLLLVGVGDDRSVLGARPRHGDRTAPARIQALIANSTEPSVVAGVEVIAIEGVEVIVVSVPPSTSVVGTADGKYIRRAVDVRGRPQCLPMRPHEVLGRAGSVGAQDYSRVPLPDLTIDHLSEVELARLRDYAGDGGDAALGTLSNEDLLKALGLVASGGELTVGALLLFGREDAIAQFVPTHEVAFQELDHLAVRINRAGHPPLLRAMSELVESVKARNTEEELDIGMFRVGLPRFADVAVRELLANALVHRDYTALGTVLVQLDNDDLMVSNPGGFPAGVTTDNLLTAPPRPRNPAIADVFKRAGLVERTGRGINRVFVSQLSLGRPAPDYSRSTGAWVEARLRSGPADRELAGFIAASERDGRQFSLQDLLALHEVRAERRITSARAAELFEVSPEEARAELNRLVEQGVLEARGERKGRTYHLSAALYRRLGEPAQYVRTRGFDDLQQEQMVLTWVKSHGSITRREAAELCQLEPEQASRLLRRLRSDGKLELVGEKRAARYVKPTGGE